MLKNRINQHAFDLAEAGWNVKIRQELSGKWFLIAVKLHDKIIISYDKKKQVLAKNQYYWVEVFNVSSTIPKAFSSYIENLIKW